METEKGESEILIKQNERTAKQSGHQNTRAEKITQVKRTDQTGTQTITMTDRTETQTWTNVHADSRDRGDGHEHTKTHKTHMTVDIHDGQA